MKLRTKDSIVEAKALEHALEGIEQNCASTTSIPASTTPSGAARKRVKAATMTTTTTVRATTCGSALRGLPKSRAEGQGGPVLYSFDDLPVWAQDNGLIDGAYRDHHPAREGWRRCVASVLQLHNETVNIWTHFLGVLGYAPLFYYTFAHLMTEWGRAGAARGQGATTTDYAVWACFALGAVCCLSFSTAFHTLMNHSAAGFRRFIVLDYSGIVMLIWGSHIIASNYLYFCSDTARIALMVFITVLGTMVLGTMLIPKYMQPEYRLFRACLFGGMGATGLLPIGYYAAAHYGSGCGPCDAMVHRLAGMLGSYGFGVCMYALRFPESSYGAGRQSLVRRGQFNYFFASHQWLHVGVLFGVGFHWSFAALATEYVHSAGFSCDA